MSSSNCCFLTCLLVCQEAGNVAWYSICLRISPFFVIYTVPGFSVVSEAELDVFMKFSSFFYEPTDVGNFIFGFTAFSKSSLYIWMLLIHILLKPSLMGFEHYFANMWNECNCGVVWTLFVIALLWDWNENWPFPVLWPLLSFSKFAGVLSAALSQHHLLVFKIAQLEFYHFH